MFTADYLARLEQALTDLMMLEVLHKRGQRLVRAIKKCRGDLFVFMTRRDVPYTNNGSERALRMSVIFRKVTGCFRSAWGSQFYAVTLLVRSLRLKFGIRGGFARRGARFFF